MTTKTKSQNLHVLLSLGSLDDKGRVDLGTTIGNLAPTSPLCTQNVHMQASVTELAGLSTDLKTADAQVTHDEAQLLLSKGVRDTTRTKFDRSVGVFTSLVENNATTVDQAAGVGLTARIGKAPPAPLTPPEGVVVKLGNKHGQFRVSVKTAVAGGKFGAQASVDPIGATTWVDLPGAGRSRLVTGHASGTLVWVRFRRLRGQVPSDWCAPVPVTVP